MMDSPNYPQYYVSLKHGYEIGDTYCHGDTSYEVIDIDPLKQLMLIEEVFEHE